LILWGTKMADPVSLYTSRDGRISRKTWWLASLAMVVVVVILEFIVAAILGVSMMPNVAALSDPNADTAALSAQIAGNLRKSGWISLVFYLILFVPLLALGLKRRHDRNNAGMDFIIYLVLGVILVLLQALGIGYSTITVGTIDIPTPGPIISGLSVILGIYSIYLIVVMGFLKGTAGTNNYGPDPRG